MKEQISADSQKLNSSSLGASLKRPLEFLRRWKRAAAERSLAEFVQQAWPIVEPAEFVSGWHMDAICEHLEAVTRAQIRRLLITIPPRHGKSLIVSVMWPSWEWINCPSLRWLLASHAESLAIRDKVRSRRLIQSAWYQANWGDRFQFAGDQNEKRRIETDRGGHRIAVGTGGSVIGEGGDRLVIDDPHNIAEIASDTIRKGVLAWHDEVWSTRANDPRTTARVIVMQRCHQEDLSGHVLEQGGWEHLSIPAEYEGDKRKTSIGWCDPRHTEGELLWPARLGAAEIAETKLTLGSYAYSGQYQQRPSPAGGSIFARSWWRYWRPAHLDLAPVQVRTPDGCTQSIEAMPLPQKFDQQIQSWDLAFKDLSTSDFVVGQVWAALKADKFLLDQRRDRLSMPATVQAIRAMVEKWPETASKLIEDKANGPAVVAALQHEISGLIAVNPEGGKIARAQAVCPQCESGNVYLPHTTIASWVDAFIDECAMFPAGRNDDQVDAMTQALLRLQRLPKVEFERIDADALCCPSYYRM
jgi:predicted phage terminase large subunit-like protein